MNQPLNILIVEDEALIALALKMELQRAGYSVCGTAMRGEEAIALADQASPGLVLMDIGLTGELDGFATAEKILAARQVPIIFLSGYMDQANKQKAERYTSLPCLSKPVPMHILLQVLAQVQS